MYFTNTTHALGYQWLPFNLGECQWPLGLIIEDAGSHHGDIRNEL